MKYNKNSFDGKKGSLESAKEIVPIIIELFNPRSVVDLGCGIGEFLSIFKEYGVKDIFGIDGEWTDKDKLIIPKKYFKGQNLEKEFKMNKKFDLAISLEVAEHLKEESAELFVETLTNLSDVIIFSAAIPFQGGLKHINEQWLNYWVKLFNKRGYVLKDIIRNRIWNNENVSFWYSQNIVVFTNKTDKQDEIISMIHPKQFISSITRYNNLVKYTPYPIRYIGEKIITLIKKLNLMEKKI